MRVFFECTATATFDIRTGIQRVVRNIVARASETSRPGVECHPVVLDAGEWFQVKVPPHWRSGHACGAAAADGRPSESPVLQLAPPTAGDGRNSRRSRAAALGAYGRGIYTALRHLAVSVLPFPAVQRFLFNAPGRFGLNSVVGWAVKTATLGRYGARRQQGIVRQARVRFRNQPPRDVLVLLDSGWDVPGTAEAAARAKRQGAVVIAVFYDVLPLLLPSCFDTRVVCAFDRWFAAVLECCDGFVAISKSVEREVRRLADARGLRRPGMLSGHFYLGSDFDPTTQGEGSIRAELRSVFQSNSVYVAVGSLEPRKNHELMLDTFDLLWTAGHDVRLVLIGQYMTTKEELRERLRTHPLRDARLFWFDNLSDAELRFCYAHARACIQASINEGFGLPIVEALAQGTAVLCSDIPVFREIAGEHAHYFTAYSPASLLQAVLAMERSARAARPAAADKWINWRDSTEMLLSKIESLADRIAVQPVK